jgi:hypothetical protein
MQYNNLVINAGVTLEGNPADKVLVILVKNKLTLNGAIRMRGGAGGLAPVPPSWVCAVANPGVAGGFGGGGGGSETVYYCDGGNGGGNRAWATGQGGNAVAGAAGEPGLRFLDSLKSPLAFEIARYLFGSGGGSGAGYSNTWCPACHGGSGGDGGGAIWIEAKDIEFGPSNVINASGSSGGNGYSTTIWYGDGGGGGGAGGFIQIGYKTKTGSANMQVIGGSGGAPAGYSGYAFAGGDGASGLAAEFQAG